MSSNEVMIKLSRRNKMKSIVKEEDDSYTVLLSCR